MIEMQEETSFSMLVVPEALIASQSIQPLCAVDVKIQTQRDSVLTGTKKAYNTPANVRYI